MDNILDIAVGVLVDQAEQVLIAKRRPGTVGEGFWEFPGGKKEADESILDCLNRELAEEVGVTDLAGTPLIRFAHDRGPRPVRLHIWRIHDWTGQPGGKEGQLIRWVPQSQLDDNDLLPASDIILAALDLPRKYLVTPPYDPAQAREWFRELSATVSAGIQLLWLKQDGLSASEYHGLAEQVIAQMHSQGVRVLLDRAPEWVESLQADGLQWEIAQGQEQPTRPLPEQYWYAVSVHDSQALAQAQALGADFATLEDLTAVAEVAGQYSPLGWPDFENMRGDLALPVYAGGGLKTTDVKDALAHNAQGVAIGGSRWPEMDSGQR